VLASHHQAAQHSWQQHQRHAALARFCLLRSCCNLAEWQVQAPAQLLQQPLPAAAVANQLCT
jgi:hypothetical protein